MKYGYDLRDATLAGIFRTLVTIDATDTKALSKSCARNNCINRRPRNLIEARRGLRVWLSNPFGVCTHRGSMLGASHCISGVLEFSDWCRALEHDGGDCLWS